MDFDKGQRLVENEILCCVSALIHTAMQRGWDSDDLFDTVAYNADWEEAVLQHLGGCTTGELVDYAEELNIPAAAEDELDGYDWSKLIMQTLAARENGFQDFAQFHGIDVYEREVYEHWIVTGWLAARLREKGECICDDWQGLTIWGRCTTGQMISMDSVIQDIAQETYGD